MTKIICFTFYKKCVILLESGVVLFLGKITQIIFSTFYKK